MGGRRLKVLLVGVAIATLVLAYPSVASADDMSVCEFPAQSIELQRNVNITPLAPQIDAEVDQCGNVVDHYTETMTRHSTAGPWVPARIWPELVLSGRSTT